LPYREVLLKINSAVQLVNTDSRMILPLSPVAAGPDSISSGNNRQTGDCLSTGQTGRKIRTIFI
jgi:hypothetical protein